MGMGVVDMNLGCPLDYPAQVGLRVRWVVVKREAVWSLEKFTQLH